MAALGNVLAVHILVATDADWVLDELRAALGEPDTTFAVVRDGRDVAPAVKASPTDIAILDLQVGTMGGMAVTMSLRLDESSGLVPHVPVLMLLDRAADVHLARRSAADGWLIKPLDPFRIRAAVSAVAGGGSFRDGELVAETTPDEGPDESIPLDDGAHVESPDGEPAPTG